MRSPALATLSVLSVLAAYASSPIAPVLLRVDATEPGRQDSAPTPGLWPGSLARGQRIVERRCAGCHSIGRTDDSPLAKAPAFRDLQRRYPVEDLAEALAEGIDSAHPAMPEFVFEPGQIADLIAYLKTLEASPGASSSHNAVRLIIEGSRS